MPRWFIRDVILPFAVTRIVLCLVAWLGFHLLPLPSSSPVSWEIGADGNRHFTSDGAPKVHPLVNMWSRWDSGWYLNIAKLGYHFNPGNPSSTAFFPLYPLTIRFVHALLFLPKSDYWYLWTAILISNVCLLAGAAYLYLLTRLDYNVRVAKTATLFLLLFPTSFFLSAAYSESMFLALTLSSFYYARKQSWFISSLLAALATLCRSQGAILAAPLFVEYLVQRKFNPRSMRWNLAALLLIPAALFILALYFRESFGSWTVLFDSQRPWGRRFLAPWYTVRWVLGHASGHDLLDFSFLALLTVALIAGWRRLPLFYTAYLIVAVAFFASWGMLGSVPRFVLTVFPMLIVMSLLTEHRPIFRVAALAICFLFGAAFFFMHSQWNWVA